MKQTVACSWQHQPIANCLCSASAVRANCKERQRFITNLEHSNVSSWHQTLIMTSGKALAGAGMVAGALVLASDDQMGAERSHVRPADGARWFARAAACDGSMRLVDGSRRQALARASDWSMAQQPLQQLTFARSRHRRTSARWCRSGEWRRWSAGASGRA